MISLATGKTDTLNQKKHKTPGNSEEMTICKVPSTEKCCRGQLIFFASCATLFSVVHALHSTEYRQEQNANINVDREQNVRCSLKWINRNLQTHSCLIPNSETSMKAIRLLLSTLAATRIIRISKRNISPLLNRDSCACACKFVYYPRTPLNCVTKN